MSFSQSLDGSVELVYFSLSYLSLANCQFAA